jgi:lysylphosphatidylglycerol synthetase-like protein (DUF2156 family)
VSVEIVAVAQGRTDVAQRSSRRNTRRLDLRWLVTNPLPAATIAGALAFVTLRGGVVFFYREFGVEPEEVGLAYQDVLVRALPVLVIAAGVAALIYLIQKFVGRRLAFLPWLLAVIAFAIYLLLLANSVYRALDRVRDGLSTRRGWTVNPLGIRAEAVEVEWLSDDTPMVVERCDEIAQDEAKRCAWVFLGRANGTTVLFEATNDRTVRLPDSKLGLISQR